MTFRAFIHQLIGQINDIGQVKMIERELVVRIVIISGGLPSYIADSAVEPKRGARRIQGHYNKKAGKCIAVDTDPSNPSISCKVKRGRS
jgi:hypothetical protein